MPKAFGADQEGDAPAAPRAGVGFIAPVRDVFQGIGGDLKDIQRSLVKQAEEQQFKDMGGYVAKAREDIRAIDNPVMRKLRAEEYTQNFLKRFGTKHKDTIALLTAPDIKQKVDFASGEIVSVDESTGKRTVQSMDDVTDPSDALMDYTLNSFAVAGDASPRAAQYFEQVMAINRGKEIEMSGIVNTTSSVADFHYGLQRQVSKYGAMQQFANANNIEITEKDRQVVGKNITNNLFATLNSFFDGSYRSMIVNPNNDITPNELSTLFDLVVKDAMDGIIRSGAAEKFGIDIRELGTQINTVRTGLTASYEAAAKGDLFKARLAADKSKAIMEFNNSNFMNTLKVTNPEAWKMGQSATTIAAMSNIAYLTQVYRAGKKSNASPSEQAIGNIQIDLFNSVFNWGAAKVATEKLDFVHVRNRGDVLEGARHIQQILQADGAMLYANNIRGWFTRNWDGIEKLKTGGFISEDEYSNFKAQKELFESRIKRALKTSKQTDEEFETGTVNTQNFINRILGGAGRIGAETIVGGSKAILPKRNTVPAEPKE